VASGILNVHPYLLEPNFRENLKSQMKSAEEEIGKILPKAPFIEILQSVENVVSINF